MFLETICISNGVPQNLGAHQQRMQETALHFGFKAPPLPDLQSQLPNSMQVGAVKCSVIYHDELLSVRFLPYRAKYIKSLKLVDGDDIEYSYKYSNRSSLQILLNQKGVCDDIVIVQEGMITDTSFSNVVFKQGDEYFTPSTFLLNGTKRQKLLRAGIIKETSISVSDLPKFESVHLVNAMLDLEEGIALSTNSILI